MLLNPYTPGQLPRFLVGREAEFARIRRQLTRVEQRGEMGGPPLIFTAPRGVGKTSLLRSAAADAQAAGFLTAWVSCVRGAPFLPELGAAITSANDELDTSSRSSTRLGSFTVEVGVPGVKATAGFDRGSAVPSTSPLAGVGALEGLLHRTARSVRDRGGAGLVVFLDELHAAQLHDLAVLLNAVQNLDGHRENNPLAVIAAGLPSTPAHVTRAATFGERSAFVALPRLGEAASARALVAPAAELGVPWSHDAIELVESNAAGYPYFLQLLGATTWDAAEPDQGTTLTEDHVRAGAVEASAQINAMYEARWHAASEQEQDFMQAMARHPDEDVPRAVIAQALGRTSRAISVPRDRLIDKGIVESTTHGHVRFTLPGFAAYIRAQTGHDDHSETIPNDPAPGPRLGGPTSLGLPMPPPDGPTARSHRPEPPSAGPSYRTSPPR